MVKEFSAQLHLQFGPRIPVNKNHTDIVKFDSPVDSTYQKVVKHMNECIGECLGMVRSTTRNLKLI